MVIKVGINGFGRVGRIVSRACLQNSALELSAINDPAIGVDYVCYLIKFDSTHGKLNGNITNTDNEVVINEHHIKVFHEKLPASVPWSSAGVHYVVEASGMFTNHEKASGHLVSEGVKRVILTAPSADVPMVVLGVNDHMVTSESKVISCASSTLYCLAPIIKVLEDNFGVQEGFITSIHAMTPSLKPLDGLCLRGRHWRDHRSIHQNIIPAATGACKALGKILPQAKDKLSGLAFRVPIVNVSVLDLTVRLQTPTTLQDIIESVEKSSQTVLRNILTVSKEESVSSDFIGECHSCIVDEDSSIQMKPDFFKIICWYENEYSYACRVIDTIIFSENQQSDKIPSKMTDEGQIPLKRENTERQIEPIRKELFAVHGKIELHPKITSSTSEDTGGKCPPTLHPVIIKKTFSATSPPLKTYKDINRTEPIKIWNDHSKPNVKQNVSSCFQYCTGCSPSWLKNVDCNTQERLEDVKRELNKMANITEDLLKKSQSNVGTIGKSSIDNNLKLAKDIVEVDTKCSRDIESRSPVEDCGDYKTCVNSSIISQDLSKDEAFLLPRDKTNAENIQCNNYTKDTKEAVVIEEGGSEPNKNSQNSDKRTTNLDTVKHFGNEVYTTPRGNIKHKKISKSFNSVLDGVYQNIQVQCVWNNEKLKTIGDRGKEEITNSTVEGRNTHIIKPDYRHNDTHSKNNNLLQLDNFHNIHGVKCKSNNRKSNIQIFDEVLRKRNIILVDSSIVPKKGPDPCNYDVKNTTVTEVNKRTLDVGSPIENNNIEEKTSDSIALSSDDTSKCGTPENTDSSHISGIAVENGGSHVSGIAVDKGSSKVDDEIDSHTSGIAVENTDDIFDQLDSASESTSISSLEFHERKSQVIQIADLTNSLEDLARLDKICRIIEISDELSDRLFSSLDNNDGCEMKLKKWSFKDLCMRIKLDEFCNKVFGGPH